MSVSNFAQDKKIYSISQCFCLATDQATLVYRELCTHCAVRTGNQAFNFLPLALGIFDI